MSKGKYGLDSSERPGRRYESNHLADSPRSEQRLRVLTQTTQAFSAGGGLEHLLEVTVRELAQAEGAASAIILITEDAGHFTVPHVYAHDGARLVALRTRFPAGTVHRLEAHPALELVRKTGKPLLFPSLVKAPPGAAEPGLTRIGQLAPELGVTGVLAVPLSVEEHVVGLIAQWRWGAEAAPLDEHDLSLTQSVAAHASLALTAAKLLQRSERELAERNRMAARLRLLGELSREFAEATGDYDRLLTVVARRLGEVLGDLCSVRSVSDSGELLEHGAVFHADPTIASWVTMVIGEPQRVDEGVGGAVVTSGKPVFIPHLTRADLAKALPRHRQILERLGASSTMVVPLKCRDQVTGVVFLARAGTKNPYTEDDLRLVQSIADHAALSLSNARSYQAEKKALATAVKANEVLRQSEVAQRLLFEASPVPVMAFSVDTLQILAANRAMLRLYGYEHDEILSMKVSDLRPDTEESEILRIVADAGDGELAGNARHRRKDGSWIIAEYHSHRLSFLGHRARITVLTDVTARREAEQMRSLLGAIVSSSHDAIVSKDLNGIITSWNDAAERLFGYASREAIGRSINMLIPPELMAEEASLLMRVAAGHRVNQYETVRRRKNGDLVHVSLSLSPVLDASGAVIGASKTARDLSPQLASAAALRKAEEQFRQAQKLEAVGRLAGGIAHDFNNALAVILGCSGLVLNQLPQGDPAREDIEEIRAAAVRAADLTRHLLLFSRQQVITPRILDLNQVMRDMEKMVRRIIGEDIDLVTVPAAGLGHVMADPSHLDQVIMNLVVNARDAMPQGGKLTIETANVELDGEYEFQHFGAKAGPHVLLAVTDTGHGMDAATQARIFEPFFTTKEQGKGTGLGLSTVLGIVQQAGGCVWVYSEVGKGSTFKIYLPRIDEAAAPKPRASLTPARGGTETVLLVEDQANVRAVARSILERNGYQVLLASTPQEALSLCEQYPRTIHLLLTDVIMPQLSGAELARKITEARPSVRVLYMSGYTDDSVLRHGVLEGQVTFLQKPFTPESLTGKVRAVLDA